MNSRSFYSGSQRPSHMRSGPPNSRRTNTRRQGAVVDHSEQLYYRSGDLLESIYPHRSPGPYEDDDMTSSSSGLEEPHGASVGAGTLDRLCELLQKQSQQIENVLDNQAQMKAEQTALRNELEVLKSAQSSSGSDEVTPQRPRKKKVPRALTDCINTLHESLQEKLKPSESSQSPHNKGVMAKLVDELTKNPDNTYSVGTVSLAVRRKYENERRFLKESEKGEEFKSRRVRRAKYEQRKQRAYDRRKSVLTENERQYYNQLSKEYMSGESDSSDTESIVVHKHPWRSEKLNTWMEELDRRYKKKLERNGSTTPSKPRVCGSPAASIPPTNAPQWAVNPDWTSPSPSSGENFGSNDPESDSDQDGSPVGSGDGVTEFTP